MNRRNTTFKPTNQIETVLLSMPKKCNCTICETTKGMAKTTLGEKKFKKICHVIGLVA